MYYESIEVSETPYIEVEETPEPTEALEDSRNVYDGSISDSYLRVLSAYYNSHAPVGTPYVITRPSQYVYQLVYGSSSDSIHYTDATLVRITVGSYGSNNTMTASIGGNTINVDVGGSTAYVYSSSPSFLPSPYITDSPRFLSVAVYALIALFVLVSIVRFIWSLLRR